MAFRNYPHLSQPELETELRRLCALQLSGVSQSGNGGFQTTLERKELDVLISRVRVDLSALDPTQYPPEESARITRTVPRFV